MTGCFESKGWRSVADDPPPKESWVLVWHRGSLTLAKYTPQFPVPGVHASHPVAWEGSGGPIGRRVADEALDQFVKEPYTQPAGPAPRSDFNLCWASSDSPGEQGDARRTLEDVRRTLSSTNGRVRL